MSGTSEQKKPLMSDPTALKVFYGLILVLELLLAAILVNTIIAQMVEISDYTHEFFYVVLILIILLFLYAIGEKAKIILPS